MGQGITVAFGLGFAQGSGMITLATLFDVENTKPDGAW
jgi:hypothetical protein